MPLQALRFDVAGEVFRGRAAVVSSEYVIRSGSETGTDPAGWEGGGVATPV
jgi:hypothetical protein